MFSYVPKAKISGVDEVTTRKTNEETADVITLYYFR